VPVERLQTPEPHIAVPAIEALRYTGSKEELSDMYANLLATAMDSQTAKSAHPAFVDIIKNLSPDEARFMVIFSRVEFFPFVDLIWHDANRVRVAHKNVTNVSGFFSCDHPELVPSYLDNLQRLGLIGIPQLEQLADDSIYTHIENMPYVKDFMKQGPDQQDYSPQVRKRVARITSFGTHFAAACITRKDRDSRAKVDIPDMP
jgi:hypothetical protein